MFFKNLIDDENNGVGWYQANQVRLQTCIKAYKAMILHYMSTHIHELQNVVRTSMVEHHGSYHNKWIAGC